MEWAWLFRLSVETDGCLGILYTILNPLASLTVLQMEKLLLLVLKVVHVLCVCYVYIIVLTPDLVKADLLIIFYDFTV